MWPLGRYEFRTHSGGRSTFRAKGGQAFVVDVHALAGHSCRLEIVAAGGRKSWGGSAGGGQTGRQIAV